MRLFRVLAVLFFAAQAAPAGATPPPAAAAATPAAAKSTPAVFTGVGRIVAVGDIHGDYEKFVAVLKLCRITDAQGRWIAGKTHLVQTGDVLGRGSDSKRAMDLLMDLEEQAAKAGGRVHALIGNHEFINMAGIWLFVSDAELAAFGEGPRNAPLGKPLTGDFPHYREAFSPSGRYGKWISGHNVIVRINGTLFMHGGLSPNYQDKDIVQINETLRAELRRERDIKTGIGEDQTGPIAYRGLSEAAPAAEIEAKVQAVLAAQKARRIVVAHTVQKNGIALLAGDRLALIDVGLSRAMNDAPPTCLVLEPTPTGDKVTIVK